MTRQPPPGMNETIAAEVEGRTPAPVSHVRVPPGYVLVPIKPTKEMAYQAACYFYGKNAVAQAGGIDGMVMQARNGDPTFWMAFKKFWRAALANAPQPATSASEVSDNG